MKVTYSKGHGGFQLVHFNDFYATDFESLQFTIHGGSKGNQEINLSVIGENGAWSEPPILIQPAADDWTSYNIPLSHFGDPDFVRGIVLQESTGWRPGTFYLDDIRFIHKEFLETTSTLPPLTIDLSARGREINPHIYGLNFADDDFSREIDLPINRWGGNAVTRYNWKNDVSNRASDWFFLNVANETDVDALPDSANVNGYIDFNQRNDTDTLLTIPMIGWTPKSRERDCGFSVETYGEQQHVNPDGRCGNGMIREDKPVKRNDPTDTSIPIDESWASEWVTYLVNRFGNADEGGVRFYALDNEPMLWHHTHRDVHPDPVGYDELIELSIPYAQAIKSADPTAKILGPVVWGWTAFFYSAVDAESRNWDFPPDQGNHDDIPLVVWYLQQMAQAEEETGVRLLDYLDLHFYPQSHEVALRDAGGAGRQQRRMETTRNLWDRAYVDKTWIDEPIYLIPRMREWVDEHYPGTKLALTEYNWGGLEHINGAVAQADILGIFGREGLDMATLWDPPERLEPGAFAFRMYRNYDGNGAKFGDIVIPATSPDPDKLAIFAAERSDDGITTIMVINKSRLEITTSLTFDRPLSTDLQAWQYSEADLEHILRLDQIMVDGEMVELTLPAYSITLYTLDKQ